MKYVVSRTLVGGGVEYYAGDSYWVKDAADGFKYDDIDYYLRHCEYFKHWISIVCLDVVFDGDVVNELVLL